MPGFAGFYRVEEAPDRAALIILWDSAQAAVNGAQVIGPAWFAKSIAPHLASKQQRTVRRLLDVQTLSHDRPLGEAALAKVSRPQVVDGQRAAALPLTDSRMQALPHTLLLFAHLPLGFANQYPRPRLAVLLGLDPILHPAVALLEHALDRFLDHAHLAA